MTALLGLVSGRVQGVWYRRHVQQACRALGLRGYAKNLPDGRVEVLLVGPAEAVEAGKDAVWRGSPRSRVEAVEWRAVDPPPEVSDFAVR